MNDDFFELPSQDIDLTDNKAKQNRKKAIDEILKIFDNEKIQYDLVPDAKRKFINNQIGILGDYKLFISVDPNTDMKKLCSYLNKELIKYGCHVSRDEYNTLILSYDKSLLVKEQEMRNYDTIVFDIGGVLIEREEIDLRDLRKLGIYDEVELRQLMIIYYDIANENDTATYKEVLEKYEKALPDRFKPKAKELIDLSMHKRVCKYTIPLLKELKSKGYKLYYLSNASKHRHEVSKKKGLLNFLEYFDGGLISYKEGVEKPNPEFYNRLLKKYKLKASDCLFIDDNSSNIETAQNLGFKTLYYNNPNNIDLYSIIEHASIVNETLELPEDNNTLEEILNNTDPNNIYFTSDWHLFKNHYKHEVNYVNTQKIIAWCRQNIKDNDVFFYLGDISFRWANEKDQEESMRIMASLPGIKVLILGNHDKMLGQDYFANCGFKYVFEEYMWKDFVFTHRPINMDSYPENMLNIHGHIHNIVKYNTTDGKRNVNVYPIYYDNKPVTLNYIISHVEELTKNHEWNWNVGYSESAFLETKRSELPEDEVVNEVCKDVSTARRFVSDVRELAKKYDANFFVVTDGASGYSNGNGENNPAVKNARAQQIEWEKKNGFDPDEDWEKKPVNETKRSELPDSSFGIPEDRKYPLDTEQHVKSAIKLFGHAEESKKKSLAQRINAAAKKYDISIPETTQCYKYLSEGGFYDMIPEDINTIVFDMGGVLVNSDIEGTIHNGLHVSHLLAHEIQDLILDNILCCEPKDKRIKTCSLDYIKKYFYNIAPDNIKPYTDDILRLFNNALFKYAYVDELIDMLKSKGYSIYYLSNWFGWSYELEKEFFAPLLSKFDGGLFSFETNYEKPQEEFYRIFFNKFNLDPKTCLFFDDKAENISAGERLGMRGIIFNPEETPKQLLDGNFNIPSDANNKILISTGINLEAVDISQIRQWHCSKYNNLNDFNHYDNNEFYRTIDEAIKKNTVESDYANGPIERYLYSYTGDIDEDYCQKFIVGAIEISPDYTYEWLVQYPLESDEDGNLISGLSEWAMASCNPIKGISKPFILKITPDNNSTINPKLYAFSPDIISDKYLVVNENAELEIVDSDRFNDCFIESYKFIGSNQDYLLDKIYKAYKEHKIVDNTFFYTTLTGKPMLCEDQIDYDSSFHKVDIDLMIENINTELATLRENVMSCIYRINTTLPVLESVVNKVSFMSHYKDISIKEDIDGYYFINDLTGRRSRSEKNFNLLTEAMLKSIL